MKNRLKFMKGDILLQAEFCTVKAYAYLEFIICVSVLQNTRLLCMIYGIMDGVMGPCLC